MKITKKRSAVVFLSIILLYLTAVLPVWGADQRVFDEAGLFSAEERAELEEAVEGYRKDTGMDMAVVTTDNAEGKTARDFADDFYEEKNFGTDEIKSGVLFLIDMDNREIWISTDGHMIDILTDARLDEILDKVYEYLPEEDYAGAAGAFVSETRYFTKLGVADNAHRYDQETGEITGPAIWEKRERSLPVRLGIALLCGVMAGGITFWLIKARYKGISRKFERDFCRESSLSLQTRDDLLINKTITHRRIPKNPPPSHGGGSSGRSTTHHSDSGRTHGGGGRKF